MILDQIVANKRQELARLQARRSLKNVLLKEELTLIAEIKKASPSKGVLQPDFQPESQLQQYVCGGADAISVVTDARFFQGSKQLFLQLCQQASVPFLRKDFLIDPIQVYESYFLGADSILLIAAILPQKDLEKMIQLARSLNMDAVVEVHSLEEVETVLSTSAEILGVNNRNLKDFSVHVENTSRIVNLLHKLGLREEYQIISESGIHSRQDIEYLEEIGVDGVLIGESLMRSPSPAKKIQELLGHEGGTLGDSD